MILSAAGSPVFPVRGRVSVALASAVAFGGFLVAGGCVAQEMRETSGSAGGGVEAGGGITAVEGLALGHFTLEERPTGCTVVLAEDGAVAGVDVRGGAPGTREIALLDPVNSVQEAHAIVLSGGSAFGLDAASGVVRHLEERGIGYRAGDHVVPIVAAAIPLAIIAPGFYSGAKEGIVRIRQGTFVQFLEVATPSYVYPYLQRNIDQMKNAETEYEWRRISFKLGPCHQTNLSQFPAGKYTDGIANACNELHDIQIEFAGSCTSDISCNIPPAAIARLDAVSDSLRDTFADAYSSRHTESLGTGE